VCSIGGADRTRLSLYQERPTTYWRPSVALTLLLGKNVALVRARILPSQRVEHTLGRVKFPHR
jgi:hypothetical protein